MAKLSGYERETIILFNEEDDLAECYTHNRKLINRLRRLSEERSGEIEEVRDNFVGGLTFVFPKSWVKVNPKRRVSDKQMAAAVRNLEKAAGAALND